MSKSTDHFANVVIRASAGTGKTYQLSNRFIGLALADEPIDTILATTFTRKAAGEILDRVLLRLADAALDPDQLAQLAQDVGDRFGGENGTAACLGVLRRMLNHLHRLRVGTLDSFFIQIARSFGLELGLPPGWQIADEVVDGRLRAEAIRTLLQNETTSDAVELMHLLTKGEASRSITDQITSLVGELYSIYLESPYEAWDALPRQKPMNPVELADALQVLEEVELPAGKRYPKTRDQDLQNAIAPNWEAFLTKGLGPKVLDGTEKFYGKPIPESVVAVYRPLVDHAKAELLGQVANQTVAARRLLDRFDAAYHPLKLAGRALRFEDVTEKLAGLRSSTTVGGRVDEVAFRLDAHLAHLLLDEFQDTSPQQWRVLRPFAQKIVAGGPKRSFFCVGDVKQAIYGWRGGVAEIFEALDDQLENLAHESLDKSWRSAPPVIETVNQVFGRLVGNPALTKYQDAAERWSQRFAPHTTVHTDMPGHCRMIVAPAAGEGEKPDHATLAYAAGQIATLHRQAPDRRIGVLVRKNDAVARLIYLLRQKHHINASEEGGNPLTDSPAVGWLLSLLTLTDHPGDTAARFHVAHCPLARTMNFTDDTDSESAGRLAQDVRRQLAVDGYGATLYGWVHELAPSVDRRNLGRLMQLVELAHAYEPGAGTRADDFVELVTKRRVEDPTAAAPVRVMTVHQAKGLDFDCVVLPQLDAHLKGQTARFVVGRPKPTDDAEHICRYVPGDLQAILPEAFRKTFERHDAQIVEESLCVLYVAMTRAKQALHMIVAPSRANEKNLPATSAGLLRAALTDGHKMDPETVVYEHGDSSWCGRPAEKEETVVPESADRDTPVTIRLAEPAARPSRGLRRRSPSGLEGGPRVDLASHLRLDTDRAMVRGTCMHKWFEQIEWLEETPLDEQTLRQVVAGVPTAGLDLSELIGQFRQMLQKPVVRGALTLATYQPGGGEPDSAVHAMSSISQPRWQVWRERSFAVRDDDTIVRGEIDRLVVLLDGDRPIGADVLDFKTDRVDADNSEMLATRVEHYRPQLETYARAAATLFDLSPDQVSTRLLFVEAGVVRAV